jgi:hypothetical protein
MLVFFFATAKLLDEPKARHKPLAVSRPMQVICAVGGFAVLTATVASFVFPAKSVGTIVIARLPSTNLVVSYWYI